MAVARQALDAGVEDGEQGDDDEYSHEHSPGRVQPAFVPTRDREEWADKHKPGEEGHRVGDPLGKHRRHHVAEAHAGLARGHGHPGHIAEARGEHVIEQETDVEDPVEAARGHLGVLGKEETPADRLGDQGDDQARDRERDEPGIRRFERGTGAGPGDQPQEQRAADHRDRHAKEKSAHASYRGPESFPTHSLPHFSASVSARRAIRWQA